MVLDGGFEAQVLVDDEPLQERRTPDGKVYVISRFDAASTFPKTLDLVCPSGFHYREDWLHTPFKIRVKTNNKLRPTGLSGDGHYWVRIQIDGELAHKKHLKEHELENYLANGFRLNGSSVTEEFCFTPPRTVESGPKRVEMTEEQRDQIGTIQVSIHATYLTRKGYGYMGNQSFAEANKADAKKANKGCMVGSGRKLGNHTSSGKLSYYESPGENNLVARMTFNYVSMWQASTIFPDLAPTRGYSGSAQVEFDTDALAQDVKETFQLDESCMADLRAGLNACDRGAMALVPSVRRPDRPMPADPVGLKTEEGRKMLGEGGGGLVGGTAELEKQWKINVKEFVCDKGESLCCALAHQMTMTEHTAPMVSAMVSAAMRCDVTEGTDAEVLTAFADTFKCYVLVNVAGREGRQLLVKTCNSVFGAACYRLGVHPCAEGEGRGKWFSLTNANQSKEESKARRAQKRKREAERDSEGGIRAIH